MFLEVCNMPDQFYNKRIRRVNKVIPFVAGGSDYITVVGPTTAIGINFHGTGDNHTVDPSGGMALVVTRCVAQTNRRGTVWDMSGPTMELLNRMFWNGEPKVDTVAGSVDEGFSWILPFSLDAGEMATLRFDMGTLAQICSTADLAGLAGNLCFDVEVGQPKSYFAFRDSPWGVGGVVGLGAQFTSPQIPIVPGFALTGETLNSAITNATTVITNVLYTPNYVLLQHGDDYLIDVWARHLRAHMVKRCYAGGHLWAGGVVTSYGIPWHMLGWRHTPVANNDATQLTITNGPTATFGNQLTRVGYIYISGAITKTQSVAPLATSQVGGEVALQQPARALEATQTAGTAMGKPVRSWYNLR
jgi:hypothetical protein